MIRSRPDHRTVVTHYCKFFWCSKRYSLKGFCLQHAREELDEEVVQEHLRKRRESNESSYEFSLFVLRCGGCIMVYIVHNIDNN